MKIELGDIRIVTGDGALKAFVDITFDDAFTIRGFKIFKMKRGNLEVVPPAKAGKDGKWFDLVVFIDDELKSQLTEIVLEAYHETV